MRAAEDRSGRNAAVRSARLIVIALVTAFVTMVGGSAGLAHDDIAGSNPTSRSTISDPISSVEIDFGEAVDPDTTRLELSYGLPDGDVEVLGGTTVITSETTARIDFDELERQGTYFVRYLAPVPADGHIIAGSISFTWGSATVLVDENPDIRTSSPASRSTIDDPISEARIEFEVEVSDVDMALLFDRGDGENFDEYVGDVELTDARTATFRFEELPQRGTYFISYTATAVVDGEEVAGAVPFVYGAPTEPESSFPWAVFAPLAAVIIGIGAWFSYRRMREADDDASDDDPMSAADESSELNPVG